MKKGEAPDALVARALRPLAVLRSYPKFRDPSHVSPVT